MTKVKLNLLSGAVQERELISSFVCENVKYVIFDGESTGSMGLPIILVGKESLGKIVGITDAEEWKTTKECLKKIIAGESIEYARVDSEVKADDIYYRQLTLPVASFDVLKSSYVAPAEEAPAVSSLSGDNTPIFEAITPEEVVNMNAEPAVVDPTSNVDPVPAVNNTVAEQPVEAPVTEPNNTNNEMAALKTEFLKYAEEIFDKMYAKINHND